MWSRPPAISSSGARSGLAKSTTVAAFDFGVKLASADWNSGRPGAGIASLVCQESDSARETVLANA